MGLELTDEFLELSSDLIKNLDTHYIVRRVWEYVSKHINVPMFYVGIYDPLEESVSFELAMDMKKELVVPPLMLSGQKEPSLVEHVIKNRRPIIWMNKAEKEEEVRKLNIKPMKKGTKCQTCWIYPLELDGELQGVISLQSPKADAWTDADRQHFEILVALISRTIKNARLFEKQQKLRKLLRSMQEASSLLFSTRDPNLILQEIARLVVTKMGASRSSLVILDEKGTPVTRVREGLWRNTSPTARVRKKGLSKAVIDQKKPVFIENINSTSERVHPGMLRDGVKSVICLPLAYEKKPIGVLWVQYDRYTDFAEEAKNAWIMYANHAASAYENAIHVSKLNWVNTIQNSLIDSSFDAILAIDVQKNIVEFNQQAEQLLGYKSDDVIGKSARSFYSSVKQAEAVYRALVQEGKLENHPVTLVHKNGTELPVLLSARAIKDPVSGEQILQVGYARSLLEKRLLEERLLALINTTTMISSTLDTTEIYRRSYIALNQSFPSATGCAIHVYDEKTSLLTPVARPREVPGEPEMVSFPPGKGISGWVFQNGQSIKLDNAEQDPRYQLALTARNRQHKSMLCALLEANGRPFGTLTIDNHIQPCAFDDSDLSLLTAFATMVGMAISHAHQYREVELDKEEEIWTQEIIESLHQEQQVEKILEKLSEAGKKLFHVDRSVAHLIDDTTGKFYPYATPADEVILPPRTTQGQKGLTDLVIGTRKIVKIEDTSTDGLVNPEVVNQGIKSLIGFPLLDRSGNACGALFLDSREKVSFDNHSVTLMSRLVNRSSTAIYNAFLQERKQRQVNQLELLSEFSKKIIQLIPSEDEKLRNKTVLQYMAELLEAEATTLFWVDSEGYLEKVSCWGHISEDYNVGMKFNIHNQDGGGLTGWIAYHKQPFRAHGKELREHRAVAGRPVLHLASGECAAILAIPLIRNQDGKKVLIGMLEAENRKSADGRVDATLGFKEEDLWISNIFAETVLTSLESSRIYAETRTWLERHAHALDFLHGAGKEITGSSRLAIIFENIAKQAWKLTADRSNTAIFSNIAVKKDGAVFFPASWPPEEVDHLRNAIGECIDLESDPGGQIGIVGHVIATGKAYWVDDDPQDDEYYIPTNPTTRSELAVPIVFGEEVLGAINVESDKPAAFNMQDIRDLELLAIQAAIAITLGQNLENIEKSKKQTIAAQTLAWLGLVSSSWYHSVRAKAINIANLVDLTKQNLVINRVNVPQMGPLLDNLEYIKRLANEASQRETIPNWTEDEVKTELVDDLIKDCFTQLWKQSKFKKIELRLDLASPLAVIRVRPEMIRAMIEILVDNAARAMADLPKKVFTVSTRMAAGNVEIDFEDFGKGVPPEMLPQFSFDKYTRIKSSESGMGLGLQLAYGMAQANDGTLSLVKPGPGGTLFRVVLPCRLSKAG